MDLYEAGVWNTLIIFVGCISFVVSTVAIALYASFKKKKLEEEHRTNRLALAYQILSQRPEITMDQVKELVVLTSKSELKGIESQKEYQSSYPTKNDKDKKEIHL